jgi:hypothetical protein
LKRALLFRDTLVSSKYCDIVALYHCFVAIAEFEQTSIFFDPQLTILG